MKTKILGLLVVFLVVALLSILSVVNSEVFSVRQGEESIASQPLLNENIKIKVDSKVQEKLNENNGEEVKVFIELKETEDRRRFLFFKEEGKTIDQAKKEIVKVA